MAVAEAKIQINVEQNKAFDCDADPTVFRISCAEPITTAAVHNTVEEWLHESDIDKEKYEIIGDSPGKQFTLQFKRDKTLASRRMEQTLASMRIDGEWRRFQ
eukprot:5487350-Pyramimonas_sp.AAC.1